ncbi:MAG: hydroxymethylpyrimidine/phosphomethylpyrimidine kinase [Syntrophorhabdaceae bacterium]|nr:hydroxymethylpyrimidine/phosphomethylpyrimidine kinase [Syntrophorhabdaceae bacterium]
MKKLLTIAGYDPSSGAGITMDVEIFASFGFHGLSIPTSLVIQGPKGVNDIYPVPYPQFIQMVDVIDGLAIDGIKIGVLLNEAYGEIVWELLKRKDTFSVIDPVISAKNGMRLLSDRGIESMKTMLFPLADVVTPNIEEASILTGIEVRTIDHMKMAAVAIKEMGPKSIVIKGGHIDGDPVDLFFDGSEFYMNKKKRLDKAVHGTGCIFSSLMLSYAVAGLNTKEAFFETSQAMERLFQSCYRIDRDGYFYVSPLPLIGRSMPVKKPSDSVSSESI